MAIARPRRNNPCNRTISREQSRIIDLDLEKAAGATQRQPQRPAKPQILPATPPRRNLPNPLQFPPIPQANMAQNISVRATQVRRHPEPPAGAEGSQRYVLLQA
jgi:hypothetical protein